MFQFTKSGLPALALSLLSLPVFAQNIPQAPARNNPVNIVNKNSLAVKAAEATAKIQLTQYSHGDPTPEEQLTLEYMNRARANPKAEGERLVNNNDPEVQGAISYFKIDKNLVKNQFNTYPARPPLAFHPNLIQCARDHSKDMKDNDFQGHSGSNGSTMTQRINAAKYAGWSNIGENVFSYAQNMWHAHAGFNIDWGDDNQITLGHRENIMNYGSFTYTEVGVGVLEDNNPSTQVGRYILTHNFGRRADRYVLGVCYKDNNNNGFYDIGEGLSGVTIKLSKGNFYAVTSTSGGYAVPVNGLTGSITVEASGPGLGGVVTKSVSLSGENVKVDFTSALPGQVSLVYPPNEKVEESKEIAFTWYKSAGTIEAYNFVLADNPAFDSPLSDVETADTFRIVKTGLKNGSTYYWKVRAKTGSGWGDFSETNMFEVRIVPKTVDLLTPANFTPIAEDSILLVWKKPDASAKTYWIEISNEEYFEQAFLVDSTRTDTSFILKNLKKDENYYWRVKAKNDELWGEFSQTASFYTVTLPSATFLATPADNFTTSNTVMRFTWRRPTGEAERFAFELSRNPEFTDLQMRDTSLKDTVIMVPGLERGKQYRWRVRAANANGYGPYSEVRVLNISSPSSVKEDLLAAGIQYIQKTEGILITAPFGLKAGIYSVDGRLLQNIQETQTMQIDCMGISTQFIYLQSGNTTWIIPMQCLR
jgi:uncharacterized protein YkwD